MRILFTSIGRRVELVQAFRQAAEDLKIHLLVYGADVSSSAPGLFFCDRSMQVPRIDAPDYISALLDICHAEKIDALIPTIDTDLFLLAQNKQAFKEKGTCVIVSSPDKIQICRDKRLTALFFHSCGLHAPTTVDDIKNYVGGYPCFIKPVNGSSSINAFRVDNLEELKIYTHRVFDYILQPYIEGTEYTVDIFCDFQGSPIYITPRKRLSIRGGEVMKTQIVQDKKIIQECEGLISRFKPCGALTVQLIRQVETGINYYIEINPRFGGGAPLSMKAGADAASMLLLLLSGKKVTFQPNAAQDGAIYSRFDQSVYTGNKAAKRIRAIVFDLDDTLYPEKEYVYSGFRSVSKALPEIPDAYQRLRTAFEEGNAAIDTLLVDTGFYTEERKQKCLDIYRDHSPDITLYPAIRETLMMLRRADFKLGILTDGRAKGQWNKIHALGLDALVDEIIVSDELGGETFRKPNDIVFRVMQHRLGVPFEDILYVGDNLQKDFAAPIALGMQVFYFANPNGLYSGMGDLQNGYSMQHFYGIASTPKELVQHIQKIAGGGGG